MLLTVIINLPQSIYTKNHSKVKTVRLIAKLMAVYFVSSRIYERIENGRDLMIQKN